MRVTQNIAAMMTGHGKPRAYFHRFKILENATCACEQGDQTIDHLLYHCPLLEPKRQAMMMNATNAGHWPASKQDLIMKHRDSFLTFVESIDFYQL
jgi:hypothetical protein